MKRLLLVAGLLALVASFPAFAQNTICTCSPNCTIVADPYTPATGVPTSCTLYRNGTLVATAPPVDSSTLVGLQGACLPAPPPYPAAPVGSKTCAVQATLAPGTYAMTMTATNAAGTSGVSLPFNVDIVTALPTVPPVPTGLRMK
jgi:hypothetical protein